MDVASLLCNRLFAFCSATLPKLVFPTRDVSDQRERAIASRAKARIWLAALPFCVLLLTTAAAGCSALSTITWVINGDRKVEAEFPGLEGKRVAVVCISDAQSYASPTSPPMLLARTVTDILRLKVKEVEMVRQDEIADWMDHNDWNSIDYREIGAGVKADMVVAIELRSYSLHEDKTLYKGRAAFDVKVYDTAHSGNVVWRTTDEFSFPRNSAVPVTETKESTFAKQFAFMLATRVSRCFYDYPAAEDIAPDRALLGS